MTRSECQMLLKHLDVMRVAVPYSQELHQKLLDLKYIVVVEQSAWGTELIIVGKKDETRTT